MIKIILQINELKEKRKRKRSPSPEPSSTDSYVLENRSFDSIDSLHCNLIWKLICPMSIKKTLSSFWRSFPVFSQSSKADAKVNIYNEVIGPMKSKYKNFEIVEINIPNLN